MLLESGHGITVKADEDDDDLVKNDPDPFSGDDGGDEYGDKPSGEGGDGDEEEQETATETNNGCVNVNTAPLAVLKGLMDDSDLSYSVLDQIDEFRALIFEAYEERMDSFDDFGSGEGNFGDEGDDSGGRWRRIGW